MSKGAEKKQGMDEPPDFGPMQQRFEAWKVRHYGHITWSYPEEVQVPKHQLMNGKMAKDKQKAWAASLGNDHQAAKARRPLVPVYSSDSEQGDTANSLADEARAATALQPKPKKRTCPPDHTVSFPSKKRH